MWSKQGIKYMRLALDLAKSAEGKTTPDPMVGAVIVKNNRIIDTGYHGEITTPHAEAWALQKAGDRAKGATLYVNLEPCSHFGHNPPCSDLIISSGIKEVVAAMQDPNPLVHGNGFRQLRRHGVKVRVGLLEKEAVKLNEIFVKYFTTRRPFVAIKEAMTLDGKIATKTGNSRWVSSHETRKYSHRLRNIYDAILCGVGTVLIDNPKLTARLIKRVKNPIRIVLDSHARTPLTANVVNVKQARTIIVVGPGAPKQRVKALRDKGVEIIYVPAPKGLIDMKALMKKLGSMQITSVLIEGGGEVAASALAAKIVDKAYFFYAPKIFGGRDAKTGVEGEGVAYPFQALQLKSYETIPVGSDILVRGYLH